MMMMMKEAVIVAAARTAVGKSGKGSLRTTRPDDLAARVIQDVLRQAPAVEASQIEDVILGCAMPEAEQGMNVARIAAMRAGLPHDVAGQTVNRFCSSGLQTIATAAQRIIANEGDIYDRYGQGHSGRRRGEHEHGADEQQQVHGEPVAGEQSSRGLHQHGHYRGKRGAPVQDHARGSGCVRAALASTGDGRDSGRQVQG